MKPLSPALKRLGDRLAPESRLPGPLRPTERPKAIRSGQRYAWIPLWWFQRIEDPLTLVVLSAITAHANRRGLCHPGRPTIAKLCHCTVQTVSAKTQWLEENGFLEVKQQRRRSAEYTVKRTDPRSQPGATSYDLKESKKPGQEVNADSVKKSSAVDREQTSEHTNIEQGQLNQAETNEGRHRRDCQRARLLREKAERIAEKGTPA
jgi:hypothetical protein